MSSSARLVGILNPTPSAVRGGNRVTALRWALLLRGLGCRVRVRPRWSGEPFDVLVALHAEKSADSIDRWRREAPDEPLVVVLTGTDIHAQGATPRVAASLAAATRVVVLQEGALVGVPASARARTHVIPQSIATCPRRPAPRTDALVAVLLANLRAVKDPLLAVRAAERLPSGSRVRIEVVGDALDAELGAALRDAERRTPAFAWLGGMRRGAALAHLARGHAVLCTSRSEGGAGALAEGVGCGLPALATDLPACRAILGADHPGLFPIGDAEALAERLVRLEREPDFAAELAQRSRIAAGALTRDLERERIAALLAELL